MSTHVTSTHPGAPIYEERLGELKSHPRYTWERTSNDNICSKFNCRHGELAAQGLELVRQTMLHKEDSSKDDDEPTPIIISSDDNGDDVPTVLNTTFLVPKTTRSLILRSGQSTV